MGCGMIILRLGSDTPLEVPVDGLFQGYFKSTPAPVEMRESGFGTGCSSKDSVSSNNF